MSIKNGIVKPSDQIDFADDFFKRSHATDPGYYVWFGMWKGPFKSHQDARDAYREWNWEAKHS